MAGRVVRSLPESRAATPGSNHRRFWLEALVWVAIGCGAAVHPHHSWAAVAAAATATRSSQTAATADKNALPASATAARPRWTDLSSAQHEALLPLASHWDALSRVQKTKWLALSKNFHALPASERVRLHARMEDWAALTPQQRRTARLNFVETRRMTLDEKKEKWQAYQALTPAVRSKFTEAAARAPSGAAALQLAPRQKLAQVPVSGSNRTARPLIAAPEQLDPHTLLPQVNTPDGAAGARK